MTSKKTYEAVAAILADAYVNGPSLANAPSATRQWTVAEIAFRLADYFQKDNPRFDRRRFLAAANVEVFDE